MNLSDTVVRCTVCGTCHHEGSLARVNSFNNLCYISLTHRHGSLGVRASNVMTISYNSILFLLKIGQMVMCPVRETYNHVSFLKNEKSL